MRVKRVLDRKRLSRIGGDLAAKRAEEAVGAQHKRLRVTPEVEGQEKGRTMSGRVVLGTSVLYPLCLIIFLSTPLS